MVMVRLKKLLKTGITFKPLIGAAMHRKVTKL